MEEPKIKTGLYHEIMIRKTPNNKILDRYEPISYANIAKIINKSYNTAKSKVLNNTFTVSEAMKIFKELKFKSFDKYEAFDYLFSEYEGE